MKTSALTTAIAVLLGVAGTTQAATVTFQSVSTAVYGKANQPGSGNGGCNSQSCYVENGIVVGVVKDPTDDANTGHLHRQGPTSDREIQYHPDAPGMYVRLASNGSFSLQSLDINVESPSPEGEGGKFVIYGYNTSTPNNNPLLLKTTPFLGGATPSGTVNGIPYYNSTWVGGTPVAYYEFPNTNGPETTVNLGDELPAEFGNITAFWLHYYGFPYTPGINYSPGTYPDWDIRVDNIVLGDPISPPPIPLPAAFWLLGGALMGLTVLRKKSA